MNCKKCGCDTFIKKDDWYECVNCGAIAFDTEVRINDLKSPTKKIEQIDNNADYSQPKAPYTISTDDDSTIKSQVENADDTENADSSDNQKNKKPKSKLRETVDFFIPIVAAIILAIILKTLVFANVVVPTGSMVNTIHEGDRIIASRLAYISSEPERYDIIIFRYPDDEEQCFVKRVIGLPGETVEIVDGIVYVTKTDGSTIQLEDDFVTNCIPIGDFGPYNVPEDSYFMMGDNRNTSWDSRYWDHKYVHKSKILGKVKFRYYPGFSKVE